MATPDKWDNPGVADVSFLVPGPVRAAVISALSGAFDSDRFPQEQYHSPPGDPGLFGPRSVTWRVHADPAMFVGGLSALMLQALHPLAMAGVAEHSDFRERPLQRLSRTASFVAATTYGSTEVAESVIRVVRNVHRRVVGTAPDGRPYSASDPALLTWVHTAEAASFLRAQRRYALVPVRGADVDRYYAEVSTVAVKLGATNVPRSRAEVGDYFRDVRPQLVAGAQAHEALRFLMSPVGGDPVTRTASQVLVLAAVGLLPAWARDLYGMTRLPVVEHLAVRPATRVVLSALSVVGGRSPVTAEAKARAEAAA